MEVAIVVQVVLAIKDEFTVVAVNDKPCALAVVVPADLIIRGQMLRTVIAVVVGQLMLVIIVIVDDFLAFRAFDLQF